MLDEPRDLEQHTDLRKRLLDRTLQPSLDDPGPLIFGEKVMAKMKAMFAYSKPYPVLWKTK